MKYYVSLVLSFFILCFIELLFARIFPLLSFSFILTFLLTAAFFVPTKTRYYYRSLIPISIICGLAVDGMSVLPMGVVLVTYLIVSLLVMNIAKNLPQGDDLRAFATITFCSVFIVRVVLSAIFNHFSLAVLEKDLVAALISAALSSVIGLFVVYLSETKGGLAVVKILFSEE